MPPILPRARRCLVRLATVLGLSQLAGCGVLNHGMLAASGPIMAQERHLFLVVCFVMLFVVGPVLLLTPIFAWYYRLSNTKSVYRPDWAFSWSLEGLIWIPPSLIVVVLAFVLWDRTHALDPYQPLPSDRPATEIQAVALDWKWLFIYPDAGVASVNELVFPADRPVHLELTSGTVMQSLLLPRLAGQIYAMAGMRTELNFAADHPGLFSGENVQYSGDGFPHEHFAVKALDPGAYGTWLAEARAGGGRLDLDGYKHLATMRSVSKPQTFGALAPDLFQGILDQTMPGVRSADMTMKGMK